MTYKHSKQTQERYAIKNHQNGKLQDWGPSSELNFW